jgi:hypothetical protein
MMGLEAFDTGSVRIGGLTLDAGVNTAQRRALQQRAGLVFQQWHLFPHMTALENVMEAPCPRASGPRRHPRARGPWICSRRWASLTGWTLCRATCREGSSSAARLHARWPWSRTCSSWTSPPARSIRSGLAT